jgi:hypothetical protein
LLISLGIECFKKLSKLTEASKKPKLDTKDVFGSYPYTQALKLHKAAMDSMKVPRRELKDKEEIERRNKLFAETAKMLDYYQADTAISQFRDRFANGMFLFRTILYVVYLILLTSGLTIMCSIL